MIANYLKISRKKEVIKRPTIVPDKILVGSCKIGHAFLIFVLKFGSWRYVEITIFKEIQHRKPLKSAKNDG